MATSPPSNLPYQAVPHNGSETTLTSPQASQILPKQSAYEPLPRITYDLRQHKKGIIIAWGVLLTSSLIIPIVLYYALKYGTSLEEASVLAVPTAIFGAPTLISLVRRCWSLLKKNSTSRPLGGTRWQMDYFNWNFILGFIVVTVIISVGDAIPDARVAALGLPFLVTEVSFQLLVGAILQTFNISCPFRISSVPKGDPIRGGVYAIAEDIIAVDSHAGQQFRQELWRRWEASKEIRQMCLFLDWAWGVFGCAIGIATIVLMFTIDNHDVSYTIGWAVPWGFAVVGGVGTLQICKTVIKKEWKKANSQGVKYGA